MKRHFDDLRIPNCVTCMKRKIYARRIVSCEELPFFMQIGRMNEIFCADVAKREY